MKKLSLIFVMFALIALTNCTTHTVKLGKKCTKVADNSTYEKSFVWVVKKETVSAFDQKINKNNCTEIEGKV
jgi:hypothetical protein